MPELKKVPENTWPGESGIYWRCKNNGERALYSVERFWFDNEPEGFYDWYIRPYYADKNSRKLVETADGVTWMPITDEEFIEALEAQIV